MRPTAPYLWVPQQKIDSKPSKKVHVDPNVLSLRFASLKDFTADKTVNFAPIQCKTCVAMLTHFSKGSIFAIPEYEKKSPNSPLVWWQSNSTLTRSRSNVSLRLDLNKDANVWICEFCGNHQEIQVQPNQLPQGDEMFYLLENPQNTNTRQNGTRNCAYSLYWL